MCGISGILDLDGRAVDRGQIESLNRRLAHRGPDGEDVFLQGPIALGHRRLAIIDLVSGRQPMANEDGSIMLVANGEIYNFRELRRQLESLGHRFASNSDCEVIVHGYEEWGASVVERLRGMFAFGLWDGRRRELLLARDRIGIKPLCYLLDDHRLAFASELQALESLPDFPREVDLEALDNYLHLQYIPAPKTIYRGVRKLEPGHTLTVSADGRTAGPRRYWKWQWNPQEGRSEQSWLEELDASLQDAVRSHLVADVPFGAFLSGGVDSSTVVAYAARELGVPLNTYTIGFDTPAFDEREPARQFAALAGTRHHESVVGLDALALLPELVRHYGEPFADSSSVCTWRVCEQARKHVTMVLSGDGGDEVFAGYNYFPKLVDRYPPVTGLALIRRGVGNLLRQAQLLASAPSLAEAWYGRSPWFDESRRLQLWRPALRPLTSATSDWNEARFSEATSGDVLSRCQQVDIETYLPNSNLAKVDIASMAHGLEVRVPLLDHRLLDTVARLPPDLRLRRIESGSHRSEWCGKYLLKRAASRFYPWEMLTTQKRGFSVPVGAWLAGDQKPAVRETLLGTRSGLDEWFEPSTIAGLIDEHGVSADHGQRLWSLLVLAQWHAEHRA
jgi:asparagine synthase (glutamine-hydrolysing)